MMKMIAKDKKGKLKGMGGFSPDRRKSNMQNLLPEGHKLNPLVRKNSANRRKTVVGNNLLSGGLLLQRVKKDDDGSF